MVELPRQEQDSNLHTQIQHGPGPQPVKCLLECVPAQRSTTIHAPHPASGDSKVTKALNLKQKQRCYLSKTTGTHQKPISTARRQDYNNILGGQCSPWRYAIPMPTLKT